MLQIISYVEARHGVDQCVMVGDGSDLPFLSTHPSPVSTNYPGVFNDTLAREGLLLDQIRACVNENTECTKLHGNHELRFYEWLAKYAKELLGVCKRGDTDNDPVLSWENLLDTAARGWKLTEKLYPNSVLWLNERLVIAHGTQAKATSAQTLGTYLGKGRYSIVTGHAIKPGLAWATQEQNDEKYQYFSMVVSGTPRMDGVVPSPSVKNNSRGEITPSGYVNGIQSMAIIHYTEDCSIQEQPVLINIADGKAIYDGQLFTASCDVSGNPLEVAA